MLSFLPPTGSTVSPRAQYPVSNVTFLETCPPHARARALTDFGAIAQDVALALCRSRQGGSRSSIDVWDQFCDSLNLDPTLANCPDPIPAIQLFAHRYRTGEIAPNGAQVRGKTVGGADRAVGQAFAGMGLPDPRLSAGGHLDLRLSRQLSSYTKHDCPPTRVKPIPLPVLRHAVRCARALDTPYHHALADMIILGFYFLLRPGEYADTANPESSPFRLCDVHLFCHGARISPQQLAAGTLPTFVALEFTTQKNGVKGELIGLGASGDPSFCPVHTVRNRVLALVQHRAALTTPLYTYYANNLTFSITSAHLTSALRVAVQIVGIPLGLTPPDISTRSLRCSGAMALLCANVDTDRIRLLGRWRSDEMLRYLHVQAVPVVAPIAAAMLRNGHFNLLPNQPLPAP